MSNDAKGGINKEMRDINDKLDSLHNRMDRFYAWRDRKSTRLNSSHIDRSPISRMPSSA